jgi:hypothetical protein
VQQQQVEAHADGAASGQHAQRGRAAALGRAAPDQHAAHPEQAQHGERYPERAGPVTQRLEQARELGALLLGAHQQVVEERQRPVEIRGTVSRIAQQRADQRVGAFHTPRLEQTREALPAHARGVRPHAGVDPLQARRLEVELLGPAGAEHQAVLAGEQAHLVERACHAGDHGAHGQPQSRPHVVLGAAHRNRHYSLGCQ